MNNCPPHAESASLFQLLKAVYNKWSKDRASRLAAAFSYYAIFSIGPLLIIAITLISFIYGQKAANDEIRPQITSFVGDKAAEFIQDLIKKAAFSPSFSFAGVISVVLILYAAANLFVSLQDSLNVIFGVEPKPDRGVMGLLKDRALTFVMVFIVGFFVLASIVLSILLAAVTKNLTVGNPALTALLLQSANFLASAVIFTGVFALMFKYLPDINIDWHDTLIGAAFTAILFTLARIGLGYYLGRSSTAGPFGAAGSLVIVMLFIYYSSQIFFLGAEFTQVWACRAGQPITPSANALAVAPDPADGTRLPEEKNKILASASPADLAIPRHPLGWHWAKVGETSEWKCVPARWERPGHWPTDRYHPPMQQPRKTPVWASASLATLLVLPVAWVYLRRR